MEQATIQEIVLSSIELSNRSREVHDLIPVATDTILFGAKGHLDSMGLVTLLMDIEDALADNGIDVSLSDEKAMSTARSPFKSVESITSHISQIIENH